MKAEGKKEQREAPVEVCTGDFDKTHNANAIYPEEQAAAGFLRRVLECGIAALLATVLLIFTYQLWGVDLSIPFTPAGDSLAVGGLAKGLMENSWYLFNPALGAPYGREFQDYPAPEILHIAALKLIGFFSPNYAFAVNFYFCLTFPLTAVLALLVLRRYGVSFFVSLVCSLLFAFLPSHIYRGTAHLFLACYYTIPLAFVLALEVSGGHTLAAKRGSSPGAGKRGLRLWQTSVIALIIGVSGLYYAFFSGFLAFVAGIYGAITRRSWRPLAEVFAVGVAVVIILGVTSLPTLLYISHNGSNALVAKRAPAEAETYGLRITQLLLPIQDHRISLFRNIRLEYDIRGMATGANESSFSSLGIVGAAGFVVLLGCLALDSNRGGLAAKLRLLSVLNIAAVLLATIGGFGSIFAFTITPGIRGYNRISVFIAFMALFAVALLLDTVRPRRPRNVILYMVGLGCLLLCGIYDQTPSPLLLPYAVRKKAFWNEDAFVKRIERSLPERSMIFQLPHMRWPENGPMNRLADYEPIRGYLHSRSLRWTYGAMKGRYGDSWLEYVSQRPVPEMLATLTFAGYAGIWINAQAYQDSAAELISTLRSVLREQPVVNDAGDVVFFDIRAFGAQLRRQYTDGEWLALRRDVLNPVFATWAGTCSTLEGSPAATNWRWCGNRAELVLEQQSDAPRPLTMSMSLQSASAEPSTVDISGPGVHRRLTVSRGSVNIRDSVTARPGRTTIQIVSTGKPVHVQGDPRTLVFNIVNFRIVPKETQRSSVNVVWNGCTAESAQSPDVRRWCTGSPELTLSNSSSKPADLLLTMSLRTVAPQPAHVRISGLGSEFGLLGPADPTLIVKRLILPPGSERIRIDSDAKGIAPAAKAGTWALQIDNFAAEQLAVPDVIVQN